MQQATRADMWILKPPLSYVDSCLFSIAGGRFQTPARDRSMEIGGLALESPGEHCRPGAGQPEMN